MNRKLLSLLVIAVYFFPSHGLSQAIDSMMKIYADNFPQEKVYIQFDKKAYSPGERIWYKAYIFSGFDPSPYSKNFYTEVYDANGNMLLRNSSPMAESNTMGSFDVPANFSGTRIRIRAYTTWMLNFDTTMIYSKDLRIIGSTDSTAKAVPTPTTLHFFPEGGDMIAGIENNIAFKAEDAYGHPRKVSGSLYDQSGKALHDFNSTHNGMGKFLVLPEKQDVFYALWKDEKGIEHRTDLPAVKHSGIVLRVLNANQRLVFSVARPESGLENQQVIVMAHMNQQMIYKAIVNLKDVSMSGGNIPTRELPTGILTITVFNMNQEPLAERVCFINNHDYSFEGKLTVSAKGLTRRGRNVVDIELTDTVNSNLSIAITDAEVDGNKPWDDNIISGLLLTGDLKGYIKDPYYYFRNNSDSLVQQLDLVLLTHGWRRFKWDDLAKKKTPVIKFPIENYLALNAEVLGVVPSRISKEESLNVIFQDKDSATNLLTVPYLGNGKFGVTGLIFFDTAKAYYQFNTSRNLSSEAAVIFKNGLFVGPKKLKPFNNMTLAVWSPDDSSLVRKSQQVFVEIARLRGLDKKVQNLEAVTIRRRVKSNKEKLEEEYASGLFSGGNATIFDLLNEQNYGAVDIFTYLSGRVAGLTITMAGQTPSLSWRGSAPSLYLNEMRVDAGALKNINISELAMVKVFSPGTSVGLGSGSGGVIAVYTKKGSDKQPDPSVKGLDLARIPGYTRLREFYSPDYLINPEPETDDIRTTLYWNPSMLGGNANKKFSIVYYNSDVTHQIRIILEGVNANGKMIHLEKIVE